MRFLGTLHRFTARISPILRGLSTVRLPISDAAEHLIMIEGLPCWGGYVVRMRSEGQETGPARPGDNRCMAGHGDPLAGRVRPGASGRTGGCGARLAGAQGAGRPGLVAGLPRLPVPRSEAKQMQRQPARCASELHQRGFPAGVA